MRISDWSSDVCSSDLCRELAGEFFTKTATGVGILSVKEPESRLRARLIDNLSGHARLSEVAVAAFTIKAWNARRAGRTDRKSVVSGKSVSVRVDLGGGRVIKKKKSKREKKNTR